MCFVNRMVFIDYLPYMMCVVNATGDILVANKKFKANIPNIKNVFEYLFDSTDEILSVLRKEKDYTCILELRKTIRSSDDFLNPRSIVSRSIQNLLDKNHIVTPENNLIQVKIISVSHNYIVAIHNISNILQKQRDLFTLATLQNKLITKMLPSNLSISYINNSEHSIRHHRFVNVLFADIVGFTNMCNSCRSKDVVLLLDSLFSEFDNLTEKYKVVKYETVGDAYVCTTGLFNVDKSSSDLEYDNDDSQPDSEKVQNLFDFAKELFQISQRFTMLDTKEPIKIRIGINTGELSSGVVGYKVPKFCLFGDTINVASRMQTLSFPNCIQMTSTTYSYLTNRSGIEPRGVINVKGKPPMRTYMWTYYTRSLEDICSAGRSNSI